MTGDYDLHDVFTKSGKRAHNGKRAEKGFRAVANQAIGKTSKRRRLFQHGAQSNVKQYFKKFPKEGAKALKNFGPDKFRDIQLPDVRPKLGPPPKAAESLLHFDKNGGMYKIDTEQDLKDLYACKGAAYPKHWK
jgi:hypothetical protein